MYIDKHSSVVLTHSTIGFSSCCALDSSMVCPGQVCEHVKSNARVPNTTYSRCLRNCESYRQTSCSFSGQRNKKLEIKQFQALFVLFLIMYIFLVNLQSVFGSALLHLSWVGHLR